MMQQNNTPNFLDSKTILAIFFVAVSWIGWQLYMNKKYPPPTPSAAQQPTTTGEMKAEVKHQPTSESNSAADKSESAVVAKVEEEKLLQFSDDTWAFDISSRGMGIRNVHLKNYFDRNGAVYSFHTDEDAAILPFETRFVGHASPIVFTMQQMGPDQFVGKATVGELEVTKIIKVNSAQYLLETKIHINGRADHFLGISTAITDRVKETGGGSFFAPQFDIQEFFVSTVENKKRIPVRIDTTESTTFSKVNVVAYGSQYFSQALVDRSSVMPEIRTSVDTKAKTATAFVNYMVLNKSDQFEVNHLSFMGPKQLSTLQSIDKNLAAVVDFGMFSWLAYPMLQLMKWIHSVLGNWGTAIILLTIIVRLLVLPFNVMSYKSMKVMQKLQPSIQALREKYKDNQQKLNEEMLALMRQNKANPLGGCLPLLLQFPVFLALYQVLGHSIELYRAPFAFWIQDLSLKDPFYVLPVLMGVTMFVQQKITPNTMDPTQAKIMQFMPILFALMMVSLPSGLTLYILVSSVFALVQQYVFMNKKEGATA